MTFVHMQKCSPQQPTLVFLPGWGFDGQVAHYGVWPKGVNLLVPEQFCHGGLVAELHGYLLEKKIAKVALVGWSMGANVAWQFVLNYPELVSSVSILAGRSSWPGHEIDAIKEDLADGVGKSMQGFYRKCFLGHKEIYRLFSKDLEANYLASLTQKDLEDGLDYLGDYPFGGSAPAEVAVQILQGRKDVVAPLEERPRIKGAHEEILDATGHLIFAQPQTYLL